MDRADAHFVECMPLPGKKTEGYDITRIVHQEAVGDTPAILGTYKYIWISENASIWGVPLTDVAVVTLDATAAVNVGGGIVGINYNNAAEDGSMRFVSGDVVNFKGTTNYEGSKTLTAGTTTTQLQFAATYQAETFDGTETVSKLIASLPAGAGHMIQDTQGRLYYGHDKTSQEGNYYYVTRIDTDGTLHPDFEWLNVTWSSSTATTNGLAISDDGNYFYLLIELPGATDYGYVNKFDLTTGDRIWETEAVFLQTSWPGYDLAIDADGNAYAPMHVGKIRKFASADGAGSFLTLMGAGKQAYATGGCSYVTLVDNDLGIVIGAGQQYCLQAKDESVLYNLAVRTFDDSAGDQVQVGGTYLAGGLDYTYLIGTDMVAIHDGYIYVLIVTSTTTTQIYKYQWTGSSLVEIANATGPNYGVGLYFDLWGNLVVVNVDWTTDTTDRYYFYDTDLNFQGSISPFSTTMLRTWDTSVGGAWIQGDAVFVGELGTPAVPGTDEYWQIFTESKDGTTEEELLWTALIGETVCILADGVVYPSQVVDDNGRIDASAFPNARKLHVGLNYQSKLKPMKPVSQRDMVKKRVTCKQMGISVHNTDAIEYGVHDDDMHEINFEHEQWKNKCAIDGLFTGTVAVSVPDGFSVNCPLQITTDAPLPATIRAMIPKVDVTGT